MSVDRILDDARIRLVGALDDVVKRELFAALDEFFRDSHVWQEETNISIRVGRTLYEVESSEFTAAVVDLVGLVNSDNTHIASSMQNAGEVVLRNEPDTAATYTATLAFSVSDTSIGSTGVPEMPEWIPIKYREQILDGVLSRMMAQPAKPYTNERMAIYHGRRFRNGIARARADARRMNIYDAQRWTFPQSFAVSR